MSSFGSCSGAVVVAGSVKKHVLLCNLLRDSRLDVAMRQLFYSNKVYSEAYLKLMASLHASMVGCDASKCKVGEIFVTKAPVIKRGRARSRGRYSRILKRRSRLFVRLESLSSVTAGGDLEVSEKLGGV